MATKRADGRVVASFTFEGKRYFCYGATKKEVNEKVDQKKDELKRRVIRPCDLTLDQYHEKWSDNRKNVKPSTIRNQEMWYKVISTTAIDKQGLALGTIRLKDLGKQHVLDFQNTLRKAVLKDGTPKFNSNTINCYVAHLKHILNSAVEDELIEKNPARSIKAIRRTEEVVTKTTHRALSKEETKKFFNSAKDSWYYDTFRFMLFSGCRCGEVGSLTHGDIKDNSIRIRRTITKATNGMYVIGDSAKTKHGERDIPMTADLAEVIRHQKEINAMFCGDVIRFDGLIFTSPEGSLLNDTSVNREIAKICKTAGIDKFTAHAFRDTFGTRAIESGMNPKTLQSILGHADIGITMNLYVHVMEETKVNEMRNVRIAL